MGVVKVLRASRTEQLIKKDMYDLHTSPWHSQVTRQSQFKLNKKRKRAVKKAERKRKAKERGIEKRKIMMAQL